MILLTESECVNWAARCAPGLTDFLRATPPDGIRVVDVLGNTEKLPAHRARNFGTALERFARDSDRCDVMLWVREVGVWAHPHDAALYHTWGRGLGLWPDVVRFPGHLCLAYEREEPVDLVVMSLLYGWGFTLLAEGVGSTRAVHVDHDGRVRIALAGEAVLLNDETRSIEAALRG